MTDLYETIFRRKSIRDFDMEPLSETILAQIREFASKAVPLDGGIRYEFSILCEADIRKPFSIKAPYYISICSEPKGNYLMNAGFLLQQIDLYLSSIGLGSCWQGMVKPLKEAPRSEGMDFVSMLAFGKPAEPVYRENVSEFRRKTLEEISEVTGGETLLEPVRLAPSATNGQPWYFSGTAHKILVSRKKLNFIKAAIFDRLNQIDVGIALCHLTLSCQHMGKKASFCFYKEKVPAGCEYAATALVTG